VRPTVLLYCLLCLLTSTADADGSTWLVPEAHAAVDAAPPLRRAIARAAGGATTAPTAVGAGSRRAPGPPAAQTTRPCRRWRRILIGTAAGAAAAVPFASLVHRRFENEAANGGAAAAWTVGLGALAGALIANATCDR
jgi:hypothetical protein